MIEFKNIYKTYLMGKVEVKALDGVSLTINEGEFIAIMGPSGSGKSTLMHIMGLLDRPDKGVYNFSGKDITKLTDDELASLRNRLAGFIFQQFHLLPRMSALENVELPLIYAGNRHLKERAKKLLIDVGLSNRMMHNPNELSGGQQQRVAIARSLVNQPLIILADEPTGNLDSKSQEEIIEILKKLNTDGKTVVVVTHEPEVASCAKRVITMRDGKIISDKVNVSLVGNIKNDKDFSSLILHRNVYRGIKFFDYLRQAVSAIISHKMRSLLSILGILIGVAAVIAMLALGQGAKESINAQLASLGSNLLVVRSGSSRMHGVSLGAGSVTRLTFNDVVAIEKLKSMIKSVSPSVTGRGQIVYQDKNWNTQVEGVDVDYASMRAANPTIGRFFTAEEVKVRDKVAVIGLTIVKELFGEANPIGQTIKINLINFKVIGILPEKGANTFHDQDDTIIIPVTTAMYRVFGKDYVDSISAEVVASDLLETAQTEIKNIIIKQHRIRKDQANDSFQIRNMADIKNTVEATTKTMSMLLGSIAAISLLVGGIGIMNIMLVSVTERTREIGLRKALGAANKDIMAQFLIEAVLMSLIGGLAGIILGAGAAILINTFAGWAVKVSVLSIILATTFSVMVGIVFGLWPAKQAARLNPIEALRYE